MVIRIMNKEPRRPGTGEGRENLSGVESSYYYFVSKTLNVYAIILYFP